MSDPHSESFIKTPQQLIVIGVLAFVVPVVGGILLAKLVTGGMKIEQGGSSMSSEAVAARIQPVAQVTLAAGGGGAGLRTGEEVAKSACMACHQAGVANAPKVGDKAAWDKLAGKGLAALVKQATQGIRGMPPRGGVSDLSDLELARAIVHMANQSGQNLKEPAAPAAKSGAKK